MYGAIIGDIVGSVYEFDNIKSKDFPLFAPECDYTDDTVMTVAVARAMMQAEQERKTCGEDEGRSVFELMVESMRALGRKYPNPMGAYGTKFNAWLHAEKPVPYGSFGNGSAMRVSPCALAAMSFEEAVMLARVSALVTHNHPDGVKGAEAVAAAVFMAKKGITKQQMRCFISEHYYALDFTLDEIRGSYCFDASCQGTVPQAIVAFLEADSFEDAIRNAISIGGDSDTIGAITGSIAWPYYYCAQTMDDMNAIKDRAFECLPEEFKETAQEFRKFYTRRPACREIRELETPLLRADEILTFGENIPEYKW